MRSICQEKRNHMAKVIKSNLREFFYRKNLELKSSKLTQSELADATGVRRATISAWMNSDAPIMRIDADVLLALAEYFGVEPFDLLAVEEIPDEELETSQN